MITPDRSLRLQQVADYRTVRKTLRGSATASVVIGAISVLLAVAPPADVYFALLGLMLLGTGIWNLARPRPSGLVVDGASVMLVGLSNILGTVFAIQSGEGGAGSTFWAKVGVFQLIWGAQGFWRYAQFRHAFQSPPTAAEMSQLDGIVAAMWKTKVKDSSDVIEFKLNGFHETAWKCRLDGALAVLATDGGREVKVAARDEIDIAENGKVMIGKSLKATVTIRGKETKGSIPPDSYERFQQWKRGIVLPKPIAA